MSVRMRKWTAGVLAALPVLAAAGGCGGDGRVELAAADAMDSLAAAMAATLTEYHQEVASADAARESAAIDAFVVRLMRDAADADACAAHADAFERALAGVNADRQVEFARHRAALDNAQLLGEIGSGLRRIAIDSMALEDEARRYVLSALEAWQAARAQETVEAADSVAGGDVANLVLQGR